MPGSDAAWSDGLLEAGLGDVEVAAAVGWPARVARMLEVERALARALATTGLIPAAAAEGIVRACDDPALDLDALAAQAAVAPTPVVPLVRALAASAADEAAAWVHHGATSQDVVDTAMVLQVRDALALLDRRLGAAADHAAGLAERHRGTVMAGRTLGQQAVPVTFGLVAARWTAALDRRRVRLAELRPGLLVLQLGGAAGTGAVWGHRRDDVAQAVAGHLDLAVPELPWHAERDRVADLAGALAAVAGLVGTIATDLVLLAQNEIGEVREAGGAGGSSAMPHKRNPAHATAARAAARLGLGECHVLLDAAGGHELERAAGAWQAEWVALPSALVRTAGAVGRLSAALGALEVDATRMRANLLAQHGLTAAEALATALTPRLGRPRAQSLAGELAARAVSEQRSLPELAAEDPEVTQVVDPRTLAAALDPDVAVTLAGPMVDRVLAGHRASRRGPG